MFDLAFGGPPPGKENVILVAVFRPIGRLAAPFQKGDVLDLIDNFLDLFRVDIGIRLAAVSRFRIELRASVTDRFDLLFVITLERLGPIVAIRLARAFGRIAAFPRLAGLCKNALPDGLRRPCYFFWSSSELKIS